MVRAFKSRFFIDQSAIIDSTLKIKIGVNKSTKLQY